MRSKQCSGYQKLFIPLYGCEGTGISSKLGLPGLDYWKISSATLTPSKAQNYEQWVDSAASCMEALVTSLVNQGNNASALQMLTAYHGLVGEAACGMYTGVALPSPCPATNTVPVISFERAPGSDQRGIYDFLGRCLSSQTRPEWRGSAGIIIEGNAVDDFRYAEIGSGGIMSRLFCGVLQ